MRMYDDDGVVRGAPFRRVRWAVGLAASGLLLLSACAPAIKRDYSQLPAGRVGFDDMCGLQTYFDRLAMKIGEPPALVSSTELQGKGTRSGRSRFSFQTDLQLQTVRQVLTDNWKRLPDDLSTAPQIDVEVRWSERSGVRRVVTNEDAELAVGRVQTALPYHVCLSELLFGEPLYRQRRELLGLGPLPSPPAVVAPSATMDAGAPEAARPRGAGGADGGDASAH